LQKTFGALQLDWSNHAPLAGEAGCEVAGLSTTYRLAKDHGIEAQVLETGHISRGAFGRNGYFRCFASDKVGLKGSIKR